MEQRALVTGAGGFVGRVLAAFLKSRGWETVGADVTTPADAQDWRACDVSDRSQVEDLFASAGPITHVFHLAAVTFVPDSARDPGSAFEVNLHGTLNVVAAILRYAPDARLINVASSEVYGPPRFLPITEQHPLEPVNPYAISKAAADLYCAYAHQAEGLDVVRMRPFNHSGPGQSDQFVLSSFARQIARIEAGRIPPAIHVGNLDASRDFLHVDDVVRGYELAAGKGGAGEAYNICSGTAVTIRGALDQLLRKARVEIRIVTDSERLRSVDVLETRGSHEKLTCDTGWKPQVPFEALMDDLLEYWRRVDS